MTEGMTERAERLELTAVTVDPDIQPREKLDKAHLKQMTDKLTDHPNWDLEAVVVFRINDHGPTEAPLLLAAGFHRCEAYKRAGRSTIPAIVRDGSRRDALLHALASNRTPGIKSLTRADMWRSLRRLLPIYPTWSSRKLADYIGCSHNFVNANRGKVSPAGTGEVRVGWDDKSYPAVRRRPVAPGEVSSDDTCEVRTDEVSRGDPPDAAGTSAAPPVDQGDAYEPPGCRVTSFDFGANAPADRPARGERQTGATAAARSADSCRDSLGRIIPEHLRPVWDRGQKLVAVAKELEGSLRALKGLNKDEAVGGFLARRPGLKYQLEDAAADLRLEAPYCVCPACDGAGGDCPSCAGKGFCTGSEFHDLVPVLKEHAASFAPGDAWEGDEPPPPGTPRAYVPPAPGLDALGEQIPKRLRDPFADRGLGEMADALMSCSRRVKSDRQWNPHLPLSLIDTLATAARDVASARPYAVCPDCRGKGCEACAASGFRPERDKHELDG